MNTNLPSGILYSSRYFNEETLNWFLNIHIPKSKEVLLPTPSEPTPKDVEKAFAKAWAAMSRKMEFVQAVKEQGYTYEKAFSDFQVGLVKPITPEFADQVAGTLKWGYEVKLEDDAHVHYMCGEPIVSIPVSLKSSKNLSDNFAFAMYCVLALIDVVLIIAACAGIYIAATPQSLFQRIANRLRAWINWNANPNNISQLIQWLREGNNFQIIVTLIAGIRDSVDVPDLVSNLVADMEWWERALILAQIVAAVILVIASAGSSIATRVALLVAAVLLLVKDVTGIVQNIPQASNESNSMNVKYANAES